MCDQCMELQEKTSQQWDIERLFQDLNDIVRTLNGMPRKDSYPSPREQGLSDTDKKYLCLLLTGHSPKRIAEIRGGEESSVKSELTKHLYYYINELLNELLNERFQKKKKKIITGWRDISRLLDDVGYKIEPPDHRVRESELPSAIGWIYIGSVDDTSGSKPRFLINLRAMGKQPVTILPMRVPRKGSIVTVGQFVNLRVDRPQQFNNYELPNKVTELMPGTELVILDLDAFVDPKSSNPYTRVWAKVGEPPITQP